jgi:hypothetical protein
MSIRGLVGLVCVLGLAALSACDTTEPIRRASGLPTEPPRVLLVGDSILFQPTPTIIDLLDGLGVRTHGAAVSGSGLLTGEIDWQARAEQLIDEIRPDVVLVLFVGNYPPNHPDDAGYERDGKLPVDPTGRAIEADTPEFFTAWQDAADALTSTLASRGARVYWVEPPPMLEWDPLHRADVLYAGYRQLGADHEAVGYVSPRSWLAGPAGEWISEIAACGGYHKLRTSDTVHFTDDGARRYGHALARLLSADQGWGSIPEPC